MYHQWNSKTEFVVATHRDLPITDVIKLLRKERDHTTASSATPTSNITEDRDDENVDKRQSDVNSASTHQTCEKPKVNNNNNDSRSLAFGCRR